MNYIAKNLRFLRKRTNLTQEQFAEKVDMNRGNIASYEKGSAEPNIEKLQRISNYFKIDLNSFIENDLQKETSTFLLSDSKKYDMNKMGHFNGHADIAQMNGDYEQDPTLASIMSKYAEINHYKYTTYQNMSVALSQISKELGDVKDLMSKIIEINTQILERSGQEK